MHHGLKEISRALLSTAGREGFPLSLSQADELSKSAVNRLRDWYIEQSRQSGVPSATIQDNAFVAADLSRLIDGRS